MVRVLNDLIHSDELSSGTLRISRRSVNLWRVVQTAVRHLRGQAARSGVILSLQMEMDSAVQGDGRGKERRSQREVEVEVEVEAALQGKKEDKKEGTSGVPVGLEHLRVVGDEGKLEQVVCLLVGGAVRSAGAGGRVLVTGERHSFSEAARGHMLCRGAVRSFRRRSIHQHTVSMCNSSYLVSPRLGSGRLILSIGGEELVTALLMSCVSCRVLLCCVCVCSVLGACDL
mgnify:CR=1 FL=1